VEIGLEKRSGFDGQRRVIVPPRTVSSALRDQPLLQGLLAAGAGYFPKAAGHLRRRPQGAEEAILIYCIKGGGWCEIDRQLHTVRKGDLLIVPPTVPHTYGAHTTSPWTIHWAHALGTNVQHCLRELSATGKSPILPVGEDLQLALLFSEIVTGLERGFSFVNLLHASQTLGHLLALAIRHRHERTADVPDTAQKIGQSIVYMNEHMDEPLRVGALAELANLSAAHFAVIFKEQTGCSPRDYLYLLRVHRACQWLDESTLNVKEIASKLGYQDPFHFSRQFKAIQGMAPSEYRERRQNGRVKE